MIKTAPAENRDEAIPKGADKSRELATRGAERPIARIHLLGPMRATTCFGDDILPHGKKARAILACLCMAAGERVPRTDLAALLWDRIPQALARTNLRQALRELFLALGPFAGELIVIARDFLRLNVETCWVDRLAVLALDPSTRASASSDLLAMCRGELLEGLEGLSESFDQWLFAQRTRFAERLRALLNATPAAARLQASASHRSTLQRSTRTRLRIGVLPLVAEGSEREETLAISLSQQITAALARFRWFDVIAAISPKCTRPSYFVNEHQLRCMDLDYLVDWAISDEGGKTQIELRLLELTEPARPAWSERFDLAGGELHRLAERVAIRIVGVIDPIIPVIEARPKEHYHYGAAGLLLLALPLMFSMEREKYEQAGRLIRQALEADPDNSAVAAWAAHWHLFYSGQRWPCDVDRTHAATKRHALKAMELDSENAEALGIYGHICSILDKDFDSARRCFDRSLRLNPNVAIVWAFSALTCCYAGDPDSALPQLDRYRELAPFDGYSSPYDNAFAIAHAFKGDYERATLVGRRVVDGSPDYVAAYKPLIASLGHLGRREEARPYVDRLLKLEPNFTVENFAEVYPIKKASDRRRYMEGLRLAGIPER